jgi:hypothetical protein
MTDQQLAVSAIRAAGLFIAEYLEPGHQPNATETLARLVAVRDVRRPLWRLKMRKIILAATLIGFSVGGALAQSGANPSAPQPNSTGTGVTNAGMTKTGEATNKPMKKMSKKKKHMKKKM